MNSSYISSRKNNKRTSNNYSILAIKLIIAVFLVSLLYTIHNQQREISSLKLIYEDVDYEYREKEERLKKLHKDLEMVDSIEFVEKQARERLKMVKPNEKVYVDTNKSNR